MEEPLAPSSPLHPLRASAVVFDPGGQETAVLLGRRSSPGRLSRGNLSGPTGGAAITHRGSRGRRVRPARTAA